jgi:autotransporter-associated beta strand protein
LGSGTTFTALGLATLSGVISGSSNLTVDGAGALMLAGQNTYTGTTTINSGASLYLTGSGSIASSSAVINNGTFNITGAGGNISLGGNYLQSSRGSLAMNFAAPSGQQVSIAGHASLGGALSLNVVPGHYAPGKYAIITAAGGITGTFNILALSSNYSNLASSVSYDSNNVYYNILPSTLADNQTSVVNLANALAPIFTLQNTVLANSFTYDCPVFGANNVCVSAGGRNSAVQASDGLNNTSALLIAAYRATPHVRMGGYADQNLSINNASTGINLGNNTPLIGLFGVWNENLDGTGVELKASTAYGQKTTTLTRQVVNNIEPGSGSSTLNSQGAQIMAKYGFGVMNDLIVSPYVGMRYTQNNLAGYTEGASSNVSTPLTYSTINTSASTALFGIGASYKGIPKTTLFASAGLEAGVSANNDSINSVGIIGLTPVALNPNPVNTRSTASVGAYYDVEKNQRLGISAIYRQEAYQAISTTTVMTTYAIGL